VVRKSLEVTLLLMSCASCLGRAPSATEESAAPLSTPSWAFEPWISKDISDGPDTRAFLAGFQERDIPVGVVVLDSPWETNYNTFVPNEERYPAFEQMVRDFRDDDVRTVLWTTQMVNESSFDIEAGGDIYEGAADGYLEGQQNDFFVNDGEPSLWWKGAGAGLDFFNDDAVAWWRAKQNALLDMGVAGWKLDFGEQYILDEPIVTRAGDKSLQEYSEAYYRDFYVHGMNRVGGDEFVTMVRPYDESYGFEPRFYARPEHAPVAWVGDQRRDRVGLLDALDHIFRSAQAGYAVVGSDIGGYLDVDYGEPVPFELDTFRKWTAVSALMPFFQLHGRANLAPWTVAGTPEEVETTTRQYRYWATLHHALVPFFFSLTRDAQARGNVPILHPIGAGPGDWLDDWRFMAGDAFLVAPLTTASNARDVALPQGDRWIDFWNMNGPSLDGGTTVAFEGDDVREMPLYVREGSIVPMVIDSDALGFGDAAFADALTVLAFPSAGREAAFVVHRDDGSTVTLQLCQDPAGPCGAGTLSLDGAQGRVIVRMRTDAADARALVDLRPIVEVTSLRALASGAAAFFREDGALWIAADAPRQVSVAP
jgi:alpha-glucosidase (family GH31 glycosyl hydrolase)